VDSENLVYLPGFFRTDASGILITLDADEVKLEGREGSWIAADQTVIDGKTSS